MRRPSGEKRVGTALNEASAFATFSRVAFSVFVRMSVGARSARLLALRDRVVAKGPDKGRP